MKVLIDFTQIPIQKVGVGVYALETFSKPNKNNDDLFYLLQDDDKELKEALSDRGKIITVKAKIFRFFILRIILEQFYIPYLCYKYNINVLHSLHYSFPIFLFNVKRIVTIHDLTFFIYPEVHKLIKRYYFKFFIKLACKYANQLICVSESTKNDLNKYIRKISASVKVIPLSCSPKLEIPKSEVEMIMKKYGINGKYILFIGTLEPRKNLSNLIKAFHLFIQNNPDFTLVIIGKKGWFYNNIFKLVEELNITDKIIFTGFVTTKEKFAILSNAYSFIYPSIYEGFGLPVLESINYEIPTITSRYSSLPEVAGDAALYIDPYNIEDIMNALMTINKNMEVRDKLILNSKKQINKFSWGLTANSTYNIYKNI